MNNYSKNETYKLSREQALKIANELLEALGVLYRFNTVQPLKLTTSINNGIQSKLKVICSSNNIEKVSIEKKSLYYINSDEYHRDNVYLLIWKNRIFDITFYASPEECGYRSILPSYDAETYVFCSIIEMRESGTPKYEIDFGFDIEKNIFLELFDIDCYNLNGFIREAGDSIEEDLKGRSIF